MEGIADWYSRTSMGSFGFQQNPVHRNLMPWRDLKVRNSKNDRQLVNLPGVAARRRLALQYQRTRWQRNVDNGHGQVGKHKWSRGPPSNGRRDCSSALRIFVVLDHHRLINKTILVRYFSDLWSTCCPCVPPARQAFLQTHDDVTERARRRANERTGVRASECASG